MYKKRVVFVLISALCMASCTCSQDKEKEPEYVPGPYGFVSDTLTCTEGSIQSGQVFSSLMGELGAHDLTAVLEAGKDQFNPAKIIAGKKYEAWYSPKTDSLKYFIYHHEQLSSIVFSFVKPFSVRKVDKPVEKERRYADIMINTSLWNDIQTAGASQLLAIELDNIFQWSVNFFGLQPGDRFRVLYSQSSCDNSVISIDTVFVAIAHHAGKDIEAYFFPIEGSNNKYWDENGQSLKKQFLKTPLRFSRVSSGFSNARRHPVTHKVQPHHGVDFAAPSGTPVQSIGNGTVISACYSGAGGNMVKIKHNNKFTSAYLHLRGFAKGIKAGAKVSQGQVIGYVGSTGRSTGPHLDFRIWQNGSAVNPLKLVSPPAEPLKGANLDSLKAIIPLRKAELQKYSLSQAQ